MHFWCAAELGELVRVRHGTTEAGNCGSGGGDACPHLPSPAHTCRGPTEPRQDGRSHRRASRGSARAPPPSGAWQPPASRSAQAHLPLSRGSPSWGACPGGGARGFPARRPSGDTCTQVTCSQGVTRLTRAGPLAFLPPFLSPPRPPPLSPPRSPSPSARPARLQAACTAPVPPGVGLNTGPLALQELTGQREDKAWALPGRRPRAACGTVCGTAWASHSAGANWAVRDEEGRQVQAGAARAGSSRAPSSERLAGAGGQEGQPQGLVGEGRPGELPEQFHEALPSPPRAGLGQDIDRKGGKGQERALRSGEGRGWERRVRGLCGRPEGLPQRPCRWPSLCRGCSALRPREPGRGGGLACEP